jgi:hypothetical protein
MSHLVDRMYDLIFKQMTRWWLLIPFVSWFMGVRKKQKYFMKLTGEFSTDLVKRRMKALETSRVPDDAMGIVDRYILSGELSEEEIKQESFSLFTTVSQYRFAIRNSNQIHNKNREVIHEKK